MQNDSYNRGGYIAFLFSIVFSLGFFVYVTFMHPGIDLKEVPQPVAAPEQNVAGAKPAIDMAKVDKPWVENEDVAAHGKQVFSNVCAVCHGNEGHGDGPAGKGINPPPRNLVEGKWKQGGDSIGLFKTLQTGIPGTPMASFQALPTKDRWALVQFIRSITKNKVKDDVAKLDAFGPTAK